MLGEIRPRPRSCSICFTCRDPDFCQRFGDGHLAIDIAVWRAIRFFCYATFELTSLSLLKHWTWPVVNCGCGMGISRHGAVVHARLDDRQLDHAEDLKCFILDDALTNGVRHSGAREARAGIHNHDREWSGLRQEAHPGMTALELGLLRLRHDANIGLRRFQPCG